MRRVTADAGQTGGFMPASAPLRVFVDLRVAGLTAFDRFFLRHFGGIFDFCFIAARIDMFRRVAVTGDTGLRGCVIGVLIARYVPVCRRFAVYCFSEIANHVFVTGRANNIFLLPDNERTVFVYNIVIL